MIWQWNEKLFLWMHGLAGWSWSTDWLIIFVGHYLPYLIALHFIYLIWRKKNKRERLSFAFFFFFFGVCFMGGLGIISSLFLPDFAAIGDLQAWALNYWDGDDFSFGTCSGIYDSRYSYSVCREKVFFLVCRGSCDYWSCPSDCWNTLSLRYSCRVGDWFVAPDFFKLFFAKKIGFSKKILIG